MFGNIKYLMRLAKKIQDGIYKGNKKHPEHPEIGSHNAPVSPNISAEHANAYRKTCGSRALGKYF